MPHRQLGVVAAATAAVLALVLSGCSPEPSTPASTPAAPSGRTSTTTPSATTAPTQVELTEDRAVGAVTEVDLPSGFATDISCPPRTRQDRRLCAGPSRTLAWVVTRTYVGRELPRSFGATETVTINVTTATSESTAEAAYRKAIAALRRYDGSYDVGAERSGGGYVPGQRGRGSLTAEESGSWSGTDLDQTFVQVYDDDSTSGRLTSGTRVLRRGAHLLDVRWTTADGGRRADLAKLPDRLVAALDR